jgi:hypothetical protein
LALAVCDIILDRFAAVVGRVVGNDNQGLLYVFAQFFDELQAGHAEQVIIDDGNVG